MQESVSEAQGLAPLSDEQAAILAQWRGAMLLLGRPGTGKTTVVARAAVAAVRAGGRPPLVLVADRAAASQVRNLIAAELGAGTWSVSVTTVHALARTLWQRFSERPAVRLLNAAEQEFRVRELLAGRGPNGWPQRLRLAVGTRAFARQVRACLARARQLGLDPEDLVAFGGSAQRDEWQALGDFFTEYLDVLDAEDVLDYAELIHRVRLLVDDPAVSSVVRAEIGSVLVDDYADLDPSQLGLVRVLAVGVPVLATADPDSIASAFRGADPRAIPDFADRFAEPGRPGVVTELRSTHRYGPRLDDALGGLRHALPRPSGRPAVSGSALGSAGLLRVHACTDESDQAAAILSELHRARVDHGIGYAQMAVLVRSGGEDVEPIVAALSGAGIPVQRPGDEIPLAQAPAVRTLLVGLEVAASGAATPEQAEHLLTSPLGGFDAVSLRALVRRWRERVDSVPQPLAQQLAQALNDPEWAATDPSAEATALRSLSGLIRTARELLAGGAPVDEVSWTLWQGTDWPTRLAQEAAQDPTGASRADADLDALCAYFDAAAETDRRGGIPGVRAFLAELDGQQIPADRQRESQFRRTGVQILTAHRARGQQWDVVVVTGAQEGRWPARASRNAVLDAAELAPDGLVGALGSREALAAERRLFHLACSRARRVLVVTSISDGDTAAPSRFIAELGSADAVADDGEAPPRRGPGAITAPALVAELRRASADARSPAAVRAAAAIELAWLADQRDDSGDPVVPSADPGTWWGLREVSSAPQPAPKPIRLRPSHVGAVLTCPRRYFLAERARAESGAGEAAQLGSLVHALVQQAVTEGSDLDQLIERVDQEWHRLPPQAPWRATAEREAVIAALSRFFAWWQARRAAFIGVEVPFRTELVCDGLPIELVGQIDWLERTEAGLSVVDFKTSRRPPTRAEVAAMDQLGIYQLAILNGGLAEFGTTIDGAAAVYLRVGDRDPARPKEFSQPSLSTAPHRDAAAEEGYPTWVHHRVAAAAAVVAEGRYPAVAGPHCRGCAFRASCPAQDQGQQVI
ncbi:MAG TPA: ATP-dependent DNA helicase [Propionicimonas sp.]|nr:ATP-dependent DNA helicase [Propionicimonas sp.]